MRCPICCGADPECCPHPSHDRKPAQPRTDVTEPIGTPEEIAEDALRTMEQWKPYETCNVLGPTVTIAPIEMMGMRCRKCGGTDIYSDWHRCKWDCSYDSRRKGLYCDKEHLHHYCRGCHFEWTTEPLDASVGADRREK